MTFDGESVSLNPSIGNWYLHCRSHYLIRKGKVIEAGSWAQARIDAEWGRDRQAKSRFYQDKDAVEHAQDMVEPPVAVTRSVATDNAGSFLQRLGNWIRKLGS